MLTSETLAGYEWVVTMVLSSALLTSVEFILDIRQAQKLASDKVPSDLQRIVSQAAYAKMQSFIMLQINFHLLELAFGFILETGFILGGGLMWTLNVANALSDAVVLPLVGSVGDQDIIRGVVFIFCSSVVSAFGRAPFGLYRACYIDAALYQGPFSTLQWFKDQFGMGAVQVILGAPGVYIIIWFLSFGGGKGWLYAWMFVCMLSLAVSDVYSAFLSPVFNSFTPLREGELTVALTELANEMDMSINGIYEIDSSTRSAHSNAFIMGFGNNRSIVLYDTMVRTFSTDEILPVVAHEIGHVKFSHPIKLLLTQWLTVGLYTYLFGILMSIPEFFTNFGFPRPELSVGLVLFSYMYAPVSRLVSFCTNYINRSFEYQADQWALQKGYDMGRSLIRLHQHNLVNLKQDPWYSRYHYSHPSLVERLDRLSVEREKMKKDK